MTFYLLEVRGSAFFSGEVPPQRLKQTIHECHSEMRQKTERVITCMKVDDYADRAARLTGAISSIQGKLGKPVKK
jgi:uncharacterized protein YqgV (UPF0045/DUF77 family)